MGKIKGLSYNIIPLLWQLRLEISSQIRKTFEATEMWSYSRIRRIRFTEHVSDDVVLGKYKQKSHLHLTSGRES